MLRLKKNNKDPNHKERNQRILSIYSSHQSLSDPLLKAPSLPLKKNNKPSVNNLHRKSKEKGKKQKPKGHPLPPKIRIKPPEVYERIPISFVNSNSNSQIQFSNYGENSQEGGKPYKKSLFISCDEKTFMVDMGKREKKRGYLEQQSAIKIQKVFRGYLTRKLLQKYIEEYEEKLLIEKNELKRKATFVTSSQEDSFYGCELKNSYFLSNKKQRTHKMESSERQNIEFSSSIFPEHDHYLSLQQPELLGKIEEQQKKQLLVDKSNLTLNESSIAPQGHEISLSFGQQAQHSPHFPIMVPVQKRSEKSLVIESPESKKKARISQDNTRDIASQNISISPNYYRHNRSNRSEQSQLTSIQKEEQFGNSRLETHMQKLKSTEKAKWEQVIEYVNDNLKGTFTNEKTKELMSAILDFSVKNREELSHPTNEDPSKISPTTITYRLEGEDRHEDESQLNFRKKKGEEENEAKVRKNENMPFVRNLKVSKMSLFERTLVMKQYFLKNMHLEDHHIDKMMNLREAVLRKKESTSLRELNFLIENNMLTQQQFLERLFKLTRSFEQQKKDIEQTKQEIYIGYKAQLELLKNTAIDARYLGYNIPFCRSMEIFPHKPKWRFDQVMIDQLNNLTSRKLQGEKKETFDNPSGFGTREIEGLMEAKEDSSERQHFSKESDDDVSFNYEETNIYKEKQNHLEVNQFIEEERQNSPKMKHASNLNKFSAVAVFQEVTEAPKGLVEIEPEPRPILIESEARSIEVEGEARSIQVEGEARPIELEISSGKKLRRELFKINTESDSQEEVILFRQEENHNAEQVFEYCYNKLIWEMLEQIITVPSFSSTFTVSKREESPQVITKNELVLFLKLIMNNLPAFEEVEGRLNQKMYPNIKEMLFSMRECEEEGEEQEEEFIEIGQYEYLLNQEICFDRIEKYLEVYRQNRKKVLSHKHKVHVPQVFKAEYQHFGSEKLKKAAFERKMQLNKHLQSLQEEREEILRIELHMVFDVWNQELIKHRENKNGYSGIGLNQLSLSLVNRVCRNMATREEYLLMMKEVEAKIERNIILDDFNTKIAEELEAPVSKNDAQWVLYTQQALQYGFDVVKMIELELIFDCLNDLHLIDNHLRVSSSVEEKIGGQSDKSDKSDQEDEVDSLERQQLEEKVLRVNRAVSEGSDEQEDSFYR